MGNWNRRPAEGGWTAKECVGHLYLTGAAYLPLWQEAMDEAVGRRGGKYAWWWRWFLGSMEQAGKMRVNTPAEFHPGEGAPMERIVEAYLEQREQVRRVARRMVEKDCGGVKIVSPFAGWMKYALDYSLDLWVAHERRHLRQAERAAS